MRGGGSLYKESGDFQSALYPVQDILELDASARMNTPGTVGSPNWEWRLSDLDRAAAALHAYRPLILQRRNMV